MLRAILFDLGNTLIEQQVDSTQRLDEMVLKLMPDVRDTLSSLHDTFQLGLLTNTTQSNEENVVAALDSLSIRRYFDAVVTSVDVGAEKPDRRMFDALTAKLSVTPDQCIMVGNDRRHDIEPAKRLGMKTAYFTAHADPKYTVPDIQFSSFKDLPRLLALLK